METAVFAETFKSLQLPTWLYPKAEVMMHCSVMFFSNKKFVIMTKQQKTKEGKWDGQKTNVSLLFVIESM
jgi:hypothetical protein